MRTKRERERELLRQRLKAPICHICAMLAARNLVRAARPAMARPAVRSFSAAPTVADITVSLTFIDHEGSRATVPGRVGQTISDVAVMHGIDIGPTTGGGIQTRDNSEVWTEDLFGEGAVLGYDHVQIPPVWLEKVKERSEWEMELLLSYWDEEDIGSSSRLGSQIPLTKELDGIQVFIPDGIPTEGAL